jgi:hypothetical protein
MILFPAEEKIVVHVDVCAETSGIYASNLDITAIVKFTKLS